MATRITTLIENMQGEHLALHAEHGISFYIEHDGVKLLFDVGQSGAFLDNAAKMGINPSAADFVAISHGHYDHSGGFKPLVAAGYRGALLTGKGFFNRKYAFDGVSLEYLGNDFDKRFLNENGIPHRIIEGAMEKISAGLFILSAFPRIHGAEIPNKRFLIEKGGVLATDDFSDEICLAVGTSHGFVLVLGCSHPGMMNILDAAKAVLPGPVFAVLGGTHLIEASPARLEAAIEYLKGSTIELLGVSHCTGAHAGSELARTGKKLFNNSTGHSLHIDDNIPKTDATA